MFDFSTFMSFCVDVMMMSCVFVVSFTGTCGVGVSDVYMLNNVCDRTRALWNTSFELTLRFFFSECSCFD